MITLIFDGLASLFVDLTMKDEEAKKAAKAAVHGAFAGVGLAMGDVSGAVDATVAGVRAGGEVAKLTTQDQEALGIIDSVVSLAGGAAGSAVEGGTEALKGYFVAAGAGALVGAAAGGDEGFKVGLSLGSGLGGDVSKALEGAIEPLAWKAGGAVVGGSIAAGAADPDDRLQAFQLGARLGMDLSGGITGNADELRKSLGVVGLTLGGGAALKAARGDDGRSTLDAMQLARAVSGQVKDAYEAVEDPSDLGARAWVRLALDDAKEVATIIADETTGKAAREAQREAEVWGDELHAKLAQAAQREHQTVGRVLAGAGEASEAIDLGAQVERREEQKNEKETLERHLSRVRNLEIA